MGCVIQPMRVYVCMYVTHNLWMRVTMVLKAA